MGDVELGAAGPRTWLAGLLQRLVAVAVFAYTWVGLIALGEVALGHPQAREARVGRFGGDVFVFVATAVAVIALVHLPYLAVAVRRVRSLDRTTPDKSAFVGNEAPLLGPITRWRLRVGAVVASAGVTFVVALLVCASSINYEAAYRALRTSDQRAADLQAVLAHIDGSAVSWALLCGAMLWGAAKVGSRFELAAIPVNKFQYRIRSPRFGRAVAIGIRRGVNGTVLAVIALPLLLINYELALGNATFARWAQRAPFVWVFSRLNQLAALIFHGPGRAALLLVVVPLVFGVVVHRLAGPFVAVDRSEWALAVDMRPALYLRTWDADHLMVPAPALRRGAVEHFATPRKVSFAELIGEAAERCAPVVAVGQPNSRALSGVGSIWLNDQDWREVVRAEAAQALCVIMTADSISTDSGFAWELDLVGSGDVTSRLLIVFPPGLSVRSSREPGGFLALAETLPAFRGIAQLDLTDDTLVLARSRDAAWKAYTATIRTDGAYCLCVLQAMDRFIRSWDKELDESMPRGTHPSVERVVRDEGMLGYRHALMLRWVGRAVVAGRALRKIGGRRA